MKRCKILYVIPASEQGEVEKQLTLLAAGVVKLPGDQFEVHVAVLSRTEPISLEATFRETGISVHFIPQTWSVDLFAYGRLKSLMKRLRPDLVHTWCFAGNTYGRLAAIAAGVPKIVAGEQGGENLRKRTISLAIDWYLAKKTDVLVANSAGIVDFYANHGIPGEKFTVIPDAVSPARPNGTNGTNGTDDMTRKEMFAELNLPPSQYVIGMAGRLCPQARIHDAVWAADMLKFAGEDFHLFLFGDGPERDSLLRYRKDLCISDRVHFWGNRPDVPRFMPHFDLFWSTGLHEGASHAILEAMSHQVPVVAPDIPDNRGLLIDGVSGCLIPEFAEDFHRRRRELAKRTTELLKSPEKRRELGQAGKTIAEDRFSPEAMTRRYVTLYQQLMS